MKLLQKANNTFTTKQTKQDNKCKVYKRNNTRQKKERETLGEIKTLQTRSKRSQEFKQEMNKDNRRKSCAGSVGLEARAL